jgi:hypothetical protein
MRTAVQLRHPAGKDVPRSELLFGTPAALVAGALGPIALFEPGELVAYRIRYRRRTRVFVFRTLDVHDRLAASVPGVKPQVQLLLDLHSTGRARLVRGLFAYLTKHRHDPGVLPNSFYVRAGAVLGGRLPAHKILVSLLASAAPTATDGLLPKGVASPYPEIDCPLRALSSGYRAGDRR